ncbi:MAG: 2-keto-3-deoxy-L-arabinonate dehydratase [Humisphaera sp.]|nr:2-keto-3-deoxy-L-arabinonate dehydratase [Humisphaera sp.]
MSPQPVPPSSTPSLSGVLPVFQTPFNDDETIDIETLEREIHWLYDRGADGIVMAMVSEVLRLMTEERRTLAELACCFGRERGAVVVSVGAESTFAAERYATHAEENGASAVMAIPPVSIAVTESELMRYYQRIIRAIKIPVIVQDASGYVGRPMSIALQTKLLDEFGPERVLFKPEATPIGPRLSELRNATGGRAKVFEGTGGLALVDSFRRGIVGTMPGADLIRAIVALWRALRNGDERAVYQISTPLAALVSMQNSLDAFLAIEKYLLVKQGVFRNAIVRGPVGYVMDDQTRAEVDRLFELLMAAISKAAGDAHD